MSVGAVTYIDQLAGMSNGGQGKSTLASLLRGSEWWVLPHVPGLRHGPWPSGSQNGDQNGSQGGSQDGLGPMGGLAVGGGGTESGGGGGGGGHVDFLERMFSPQRGGRGGGMPPGVPYNTSTSAVAARLASSAGGKGGGSGGGGGGGGAVGRVYRPEMRRRRSRR
jgi:hypothetical protein